MKREELIEIIKKKSKTPSETRICELFIDMGLNYIDNHIEIKKDLTNKDSTIGEIDAVFSFGDRFLFLVEVEESANYTSDKKIKFFSKWSDETNLQKIIEKYQLIKTIQPIKIYVSLEEKRNEKSSIEHQTKNKSNHVLFKEDISYFERNLKTIGPASKYDLFHFLELENEKKLEEIDALRMEVGNKRAYLCAINVYKLIHSCYVSRRKDGEQEGYQRIISPPRIKKISEGIANSKILAFPNSIILNAEDSLEKNYQKEIGHCKINFPMDFCSNRIIDGQHRLYGFSRVPEKLQKESTLAVLIFEGLSKNQEVNTFIDINNTQKRIDSNLLLILKSDLKWSESDEYYQESKIVLLIKKLSERNTLIKDKIFFGYNEPKKDKITLVTLVNAIKKNNLLGGKLRLLEKVSEDPESELNEIFNSIKKSFKEHAQIDKKKGFFFSNRGIQILFRLIQIFIRNKLSNNITKEKYSEFFDDIYQKINKEYIETLQSFYGEGGFLKACEFIIDDLKKTQKEKYSKIKTDLRKLKIE